MGGACRPAGAGTPRNRQRGSCQLPTPHSEAGGRGLGQRLAAEEVEGQGAEEGRDAVLLQQMQFDEPRHRPRERRLQQLHPGARGARGLRGHGDASGGVGPGRHPTLPGKAPGPDTDRQPGHCPCPGASPPARLSLRPHRQGLTPSLASRSRRACGFQLASSPRSAHPAPPLSAPALVRTLGAGHEGPVLATHSLRQVLLTGCAR